MQVFVLRDHNQRQLQLSNLTADDENFGVTSVALYRSMYITEGINSITNTFLIIFSEL